MAEGTDTYMGLAVPLYGESEITQQTLGNDILSITGAASQTGDFLVLQNSSGTERFVVEDGGNVVITQGAAADVGLKVVRYSGPTADAIQVTDNGGTTTWAITKNAGMLLKVRTTKPTTGLTKGELLLIFHGSTPKLAVCTSTAADTLKMIRLRTKTLGRLTA